MTYDDREREQLRRGLALLVEETPVAPDLTDITTAPVLIPKRRLRPLAVFAAAAATVVLGLGGVALIQGGGSAEPPIGEATTVPAPTTTVAVEPTSVAALDATRLPFVLPTLAGWSVTYVQESDGELADGTGTFQNADIQLINGSTGAELRLHRGPGTYFDDLVASREAEGTRVDDDEVLGATVLVIVDVEETHYAIWTLGDVVFELAGTTTPPFEETEFRSLLGSLTIVDEETWLAAMPESVVTDRAAAVAEYLADIPLPTGYDPTNLAQGPAEDWYQVGADVAGAVTCAWIEQWMAGKAAGDQAAVDEAVAAMATSREWGILVEMSGPGDYPEAVWQYADAMAGDGTIAAGGVTTVEESYRQALCSG